MSKSLKELDLKLPHGEFPYKWAHIYATSHSPFEACYGVSHLTLIDLFPLAMEYRVRCEAHERAEEMKKAHKQIRAQIEKVNAS